MNAVISDFRRKINRQRVHPTLTDYSYLSLRHNVQTFKRFAALVPKGSCILDAGCGFKPWLEFFDSSVQYVGADYSAEWSAPDALASVDHLPFPDNTFDAVICSEVIEHTRYPEACINELRRVCKPGGLIYLSTPFAFPEHGVPYDFQRPTQYFYRSVFEKDEIVSMEQTSSTIGTAFTCFNFFVECTPLRMVWGFRHIVYFTMNVIGLASDTFINWAAPKLMRTLRFYTHMLPLGFNMIIRVQKP